MTDDRHSLELERVPSGIAGLDTVLRGGFLKGGVYIIQGVPGAGKTILANQICFNHVAAGGRAAYVTLLAESHSRMLQHLRPMRFFDETIIPDRLYYISAFNTLEEDGLSGLRDLLQREIRAHHASLLILDGLVAAEEQAGSDREFKKFVHELQMHASMNDCTVLLLTSGSAGPVRAEHTMVDGLIELDDRLFEVRTERSLQVRKFRGSASLRGRHPFRITGDGLVVYPRIEAMYAVPAHPEQPLRTRVATGIEGLDPLIGGGILQATTTILVGPTGIGKTTFGLHFLAQCSEAEPGLLFGFYETPVRLRDKAASLGIDLATLERQGSLAFVWQAQGESILDELAHRLLEAVRSRGVRRLVVDGLDGFLESSIHPDRMSRFLSTLSNELRGLGVTSLFLWEMRNLIGSAVQVPIYGVSTLVENLIILRYVEVEGRIRRLLSITKIRDSGFDPALQEFRITDAGIGILGPLPGYAVTPDALASSGPVSSERPSPRE
ncbi:ATPase domain-containing protein [Azospirillum picis]|uniref:non-specific serine/threonine protein kinase n=1 Tax=Azospirillum picis TaxID=488438 RepID=A0ABU0MJ61_9PROT|nr:ATPase domain-containing protein [Azospirillum picis]MBP2299705.1 circadian clock protein KaiC [Azospirillum picis]MDQ0533501.1 circadian clock protein KaiC [Azospirillum picis]